MADHPIEVARFDTLINAQDFVNRLAHAEINAFIDNKETGTLYGSAGLGMIGIRVLVLPEDAERAIEFLPQDSETDLLEEIFGGSEPWTCSACEASVPGDHVLCWSCGADTDGQQTDNFERVEERLIESPEQATEREIVPTPHVTHAEQVGDAAARRAFYATTLLFGLPLFPFVSLVMAMNIPPLDTLTPKSRRRARIAFWGSLGMVALNLAVIARLLARTWLI